MLSWIRGLGHRRPSSDALLNEGLALAMDWGDNWLSPIQARLHKLHPSLSAAELEECNATCQSAMHLAYEAVHASIRDGSSAVSLEALASIVRARHPWVDDENLARLLRQGIYYAAKVGGHARGT